MSYDAWGEPDDRECCQRCEEYNAEQQEENPDHEYDCVCHDLHEQDIEDEAERYADRIEEGF